MATLTINSKSFACQLDSVTSKPLSVRITCPADKFSEIKTLIVQAKSLDQVSVTQGTNTYIGFNTFTYSDKTSITFGG